MTQLDRQTPAQHRARYEQLRRQAQTRATVAAPIPPPAPIPAEAVVLHETIPGGWYWSGTVLRGQSLRIVNTHGTHGVAAMFWNRDDTSERYNAADTVKLQWTTRLTAGHLLLSDMGRVLASITADSCGAHDTLVGASTAASVARSLPNDPRRRNTRDNFLLVVGKLGLHRRDVPPCISFFAGVRTDAQARFVWQHDATRPGDVIDLRAEMNLIVALSNCPHPLDPAPTPDPPPVEAIIWRTPPPGADDPCRTGSEEAVRAFENTDLLFRG